MLEYVVACWRISLCDLRIARAFLASRNDACLLQCGQVRKTARVGARSVAHAANRLNNGLAALRNILIIG